VADDYKHQWYQQVTQVLPNVTGSGGLLVLLEIQSEAEPSVKLAVLQGAKRRQGCLAVRLGVGGSGIAVLNQHLNAATIGAAHEHSH